MRDDIRGVELELGISTEEGQEPFAENSPGSYEIGPVQHHRFREGNLRFRVVAGKVIETADKWCSKYVRQVLSVDASLSLFFLKVEARGRNCRVSLIDECPSRNERTSVLAHLSVVSEFRLIVKYVEEGVAMVLGVKVCGKGGGSHYLGIAESLERFISVEEGKGCFEFSRFFFLLTKKRTQGLITNLFNCLASTLIRRCVH